MSLETLQNEPVVAVGLMSADEAIAFTAAHGFTANHDHHFDAGRYVVRKLSSELALENTDGHALLHSDAFHLKQAAGSSSVFTVHAVTIGVDFHWQRQEDQKFDGHLRFACDEQGKLLVINEVNVESYLTSVISSEMSATAHPELLKAHAVISRSWLLSQLPRWRATRILERPSGWQGKELIRWYDRDNHQCFDICADDHCQRYQGMAKATAENVYAAINATRGTVLSFGDEICDARFSKSCGGFTELFAAAWQNADVPYLQAFYDGEAFPAEFALPLSEADNAEHWIRAEPAAFCCTHDRTILQRILPSFDQETEDFYRWRVTIAQDELQRLLKHKLDLELGAIKALEPVERGASGRITKLRIVGERDCVLIGKELEIRRALSASHLYSSAFVVEAQNVQAEIPEAFTLIGAGWGHGVGLCQIGAALMAERGYSYQQILQHYYRGATLATLYSSPSEVANVKSKQAKMAVENPYNLEINQRRRLLADAGFARTDQRIWVHPDGRAVGEAVIAALTDAAFYRFLQIEVHSHDADDE